MALGASRADVLRMVLRGAVMLVVVGVVAGTPVAFWVQRVAAQALPSFTVDPRLPIAISATEMLIVALAAAYLPARRAARVDPAAALKQD